jgi:hypothetical protein
VIDAGGGVRDFGRTTGTVLGVLTGEFVEEREERLGPGERLVPGGAFLGAGGLDEALRAGAPLGARSLCDAIIRRVDEFQDDARADDVTVMVVERAPAG